MWKRPGLDSATAGVSGLMIGLLGMVTDRRPATREAAEALAALLAGLVATLVASFVGALNLNTSMNWPASTGYRAPRVSPVH
ncbi:hypothetical protein G6F66_015449 [Rhizopus arrhizus]|nr:hypothetical protein G6F66_015449 [Rhizopus arrhizus]